ncbi:two-component system sensor histidine kinase NtrB [Paraglaciecola sp. 2405UD69-4]|uniref:two-component system sensor histidine kinase NtrB n=1 Tax=Paraglaciecola sp. 2405UD69-4 TaxID=3391836 RepID=UPI0039C9DA7A
MGENTIKPNPLDTNAQFLALLDAAVDAMIVIDHRGAIEVFNHAAERMFGYQAKDVIGANVRILMPQPYQDAHDGYLQHFNETKQAKVIGIGREVKAQKSNGEIFPIELSVGEVKKSSHPQFVGIIRDISDRMKVQADLNESRERLAQFTRLSTMGEMAAGIAHEINQPLTAITSYSQACRNFIEQFQPKSEDPSLVKVKATLDKISAQTHRASEVISRLRNFVKKGQVIRTTVNLSSLIKNTLNLAEIDTRILEHGIELNLANNPRPMVNIDDIQIQQVLFNLINNAIDSLQACPSKPIQISTHWVGDKNIEVAVQDFGVGINAQQEESLFLPFYTTKASGMGVGLSISQTIIEAHGGKLTYRKGQPSGSIFTFTLPASGATTLPHIEK